MGAARISAAADFAAADDASATAALQSSPPPPPKPSLERKKTVAELLGDDEYGFEEVSFVLFCSVLPSFCPSFCERRRRGRR